MTFKNVLECVVLEFIHFVLPSATRKLPRLNSEPNGGGFDKAYGDGGYGAKVS